MSCIRRFSGFFCTFRLSAVRSPPHVGYVCPVRPSSNIGRQVIPPRLTDDFVRRRRLQVDGWPPGRKILPQAGPNQDGLGHGPVVDDRHHLHQPAAFVTFQGVHLVHEPNQHGPSLAVFALGHGGRLPLVRTGGRASFFHPAAGFVRVEAVIEHVTLPVVGHVGGHRRHEVQHVKGLEILAMPRVLMIMQAVLLQFLKQREYFRK